MRFHDVEIYSGTKLATTGSRLEIGANNKFLLEILSGLTDCATCREPLVIIFPEEEESTLKDVFNRLSHFKSGLSIIESKSPLLTVVLILNMFYASDPTKVNSLLERLTSSPMITPFTDQSISNVKKEEDSLQVYMDTTGQRWVSFIIFKIF